MRGWYAWGARERRMRAAHTMKQWWRRSMNSGRQACRAEWLQTKKEKRSERPVCCHLRVWLCVRNAFHLSLLPPPHTRPHPGAWRSRWRRTSRERACSSSSLPSAGSTACCCGRFPSPSPSASGTPIWRKGGCLLAGRNPSCLLAAAAGLPASLPLCAARAARPVARAQPQS